MLVEREQPLARLTTLLTEAAAGSGRLVLLGGEAGVGKTSLTAAFAGVAAERMAVRSGTCESVGATSPLGPFVEAVPELADLVERASEVDRLRLFRGLRAALDGAPAVLVLEDVHWADEATMEMLRFLGRRLADLPLLVVATFRDDEAPVGSPLAVLLGDLATAPGVTRMALTPLSVDGVRTLVAEAASDLDPVALHRSTSGNPFFVTEVLAAGAGELPATVRDAVLARTSRLSAAAHQVLAAAAVIGQPADLRLLTAVSGAPAAAVDECVRAGVLVGDAGGWTFRHELAQRSVEQTLTPGARAELHTRALAVLRADGERDDGRLARHAAGSGDRAAVARYAPRAAARAARLGAHREAADLYRLAVNVTGPGAGTGEADQVRLYEALSYECYLTNQFADALAARQVAMELSQEAGDTRAVGTDLRWLSRISWYLGDKATAEAHAERAVAVLEGVDGGHELAMAYCNLATSHMQRAHPDAVQLGERSIAFARRIGDVEAEIHALNTTGCALAAHNRFSEGAQLIRRSLERALQLDSHEHAGRAYHNLGASALQSRQYRVADEAFADGLAYCEEHDLEAFANHMILGIARSLAEQGRYAEAQEALARARSRPRLAAMSSMAVAHVGCQLAVRRHGDAGGQLDDLWRLAQRLDEEQILVPAVEVRAEAAWIAGRPDDVVAEVDRVWPLAVQLGNGWELGELCWWLHLAGVRRDSPVPVAAPHELMLRGAWQEAAEAWEEVGRRLWAAYALMLSPDLADGRRAVAVAEEIGAHAARRAVLRERQARGLPVPHGPRSATRANPSGLTGRELEVLRLLAEGLTNPEIATKLYLSERTVAHHVSAVLQKLGEPTRTRAVAAAVRRGIVG